MSLVKAVTAAVAMGASMAIATPAVAAPPHPFVFVHDRFQPAAQAKSAGAVTYDKSLVPTSASVFIAEARVGGKGMKNREGAQGHGQYKMHKGTFVFISVRGLAADHHFGIHVHTKPCGTKPDSSGPHYQNKPDPKQPSTNPKYANPHNEVWLDITTKSNGKGWAKSWVKWNFRSGEAHSVVIHKHATGTTSGKAGQAGARVACVNVPFK
ncbi:superoxide dismutase family protein [Streptomyces samsunensis]|uniref:Superoxide dismutase family protein n=1 Tax=Streptomyces malaysiensis TaxID=92644 RepID=A0ABX6W5E1_STRMQ|nr:MULTISPECIES: superoxide dismutase family protein [Streptomyces]MCD9590433.1 superoxide dismutase family protein [Streptomyces sp. 8ZJF_21]NUH38189.1 superoxide dismutase family protein [Streptomyces samsunensis]QPI55984.1 superoxide dismutase family protein [Streptomyces solisilvae]UHH17453.1 superoxide dismutase family protein [Streptomyces sp. HNM0561]